MGFDLDDGWGWLRPVFRDEESKTQFPEMPRAEVVVERGIQPEAGPPPPPIVIEESEMKVCRFNYVGILFHRPFPRAAPSPPGTSSFIATKRLP
jgi:hypothetical protein